MEHSLWMNRFSRCIALLLVVTMILLIFGCTNIFDDSHNITISGKVDVYLNGILQKNAYIAAFANSECTNLIVPLTRIYNSNGIQQEMGTEVPVYQSVFSGDGSWSLMLPGHKRPINTIYLSIRTNLYQYPYPYRVIPVTINDKNINDLDLGKIDYSGILISGTIGDVTVDGLSAQEVYIKTIYWPPPDYPYGRTIGYNTIVKDGVKVGSNWSLNIGTLAPEGGLVFAVYVYSPDAYISTEKPGRTSDNKMYKVKALPGSIDFGDLNLFQ